MAKLIERQSAETTYIFSFSEKEVQHLKRITGAQIISEPNHSIYLVFRGALEPYGDNNA
jgi:hypothetical protein